MAKPNYRQQKKSKEHARKVRQEEKLQRRKSRAEEESGTTVEPVPVAVAGDIPPKQA
jgi:hypothetical protein